ncbi:MAG TPA: aldehyde dehydrogenase family protein, partial [Sandaracinaceae bacterium LLY-WYZ-13_1]|nr:aldehyde dehydrogenase family protein [Sandaracinaceae bacterium LLY-WYZ-13_1]
MTSPNFASDAPKVSSTPLEEIDRLVEQLAAKKDAWVRTPLTRRVHLLRRCIVRTEAVAEDWVRAACRAKAIDFHGPRAGEEWLGGPVTTLRNLRLLAESLEAGGQPAANQLTQRPDGQWVAEVFPTNGWDKLLFGGITGEVWIEPGQEPTQGRIYREKARGEMPEGKVSLVLGAGNVASIGPMDALHKLFVEDEVVIVKTNPVNAYLQPYWEEAFRPLLDEGVFYVVRGGADVGSHLVHHEKVDTIHMTGSDRTHDAIVWGSDPEEQARRKRTGEKLVDKPISSELGAVTPVLVVPGPWSDEDLDFQARHVAGMITNNASFNCNAAKVVAVADGWPQREIFMEKLERHLAETPPRVAYYPGAHRRYEGFLESYPQAKALGPRSERVVPWTVIPEVPAEKGEYALTNEAFCGVVAQTKLPASDPASFLKAMVDFANDDCWGTLSCMVLVHPETRRKHAAAFDQALQKLRYGGIGVNAWAGLIYGLVSPTW